MFVKSTHKVLCALLLGRTGLGRTPRPGHPGHDGSGGGEDLATVEIFFVISLRLPMRARLSDVPRTHSVTRITAPDGQTRAPQRRGAPQRPEAQAAPHTSHRHASRHDVELD